jgi:metallo-beta-lactamase class B
MRTFASGLLVAVATGAAFGGVLVRAQAPSPSAAAAPHVAAAKAAARTDHVALFNQLCVPPPPAAPQARPAAQQAAPQGPPPRSRWYAEPVKVFDNLYFLGQTEYTAWAVTTSDGIIVIDPLFDYSVEEEVVNGLTKLGLDPKRIRYVVISHAHRDHVGGARLLQGRGARVVMSAADWDLLADDPGSWPKAKRDIVATDGQKLTLGDTTLTLHFTPGHTLGTISTIIPLKDGGRTHVGALWGGTNFNWRNNAGARYITAERPATFWYDTYATGARRFRDTATKAGADVLLSNHPQYDGTKAHLATLARRQPGEPHPYVVGTDSVSRFLTVAEECAKAGPLW